MKNKAPLLKCNIIHSIPGRVRVGCRALKYLDSLKSKIEIDINKVSFIKKSQVNTITKNILIEYNANDITQDEIIGFFEEIISNYSLIAYKREKEEERKKIPKGREVEESVGSIAKRLLINAGVIAYSVLSKKTSSIQLIPHPIYGRFTTIPALASIYLTKPIFKSGINGLKEDLKPNADTLTMASILTSLVLGNDISALTIILLSDVAELLTSYTMAKTRDSIKDMLSLKDEYVWKILDDGSVKKYHIDTVKKGDKIVVHTGEKVCIDGKVISGEAVVDEAAITGEYMPDIKRDGSYVYAGGVVKNGNITVFTEKAGDDTVVSRIINLVEDAATQKAPIQNYADKFSSYFIPFNFLLAGVTYLVTKSPMRALNMMVIDYSCGIKLSTATAFSASINTAVRNGVLIKGGNYIETLSDSDTLIFDKTGTLTEGKPDVTSVIVLDNDFTEKKILEISTAAEETSSHPMAVAILSKGRKEGINIPKHGEIITHVARGTETTVKGKIIRVGNKAFMEENNIDISKSESKVQILFSRGESVVYVSSNNKLVGVLGIQDKMRENMKKAINNLRYKGIDDMILLTGDLKEQAEVVANKMGVDSYEAELLPEDKAKIVLKLQSRGSKVTMIGDGINDAPALAYSNVGISLGGRSTDVAMETSDITIQSDNPMMIPTIIDLSKKTMTTVKQNFGLVVSINTIGLLLGATGVMPVFWGAVLHNSSTILVVSNSLRLLFYNMERGN